MGTQNVGFTLPYLLPLPPILYFFSLFLIQLPISLFFRLSSAAAGLLHRLPPPSSSALSLAPTNPTATLVGSLPRQISLAPRLKPLAPMQPTATLVGCISRSDLPRQPYCPSVGSLSPRKNPTATLVGFLSRPDIPSLLVSCSASPSLTGIDLLVVASQLPTHRNRSTSFVVSPTLPLFSPGAKSEMDDEREVIDKSAEENPMDTPSEIQETRNEMLARHRKENSQLQNKEIEMKKGAAKGSKAEQKAKKKQVEEEILKQSAKLKQKQAEELAKLGYCGSSAGNNDQSSKANLENLVKAIAGVSVSNNNSSQADQAKGVKPSKSVKRREKRAQEEAAREQRIKDEQSSIVSDRAVEDERLEEKLTPLGLTINQVKPDGHCLYRAVEDQLSRLGGGGPSPHTFQQLREMVASYMRQHTSDFLPFLLSEGGESEKSSSLAERFESYCKQVESSAAWGGQMEIGAMTHSLRKHIMIFSGSFPDVEMGKEYKSEQDNSTIMLSYHRHAFGLGEHYNSVVPLSQQ